LSAGRKRVETLQAALAPARSKINPVVFQAIDEELNEAASVRRKSDERRRKLLKIVHYCKELDTTLKLVISSNGETPKWSLGPRFRQMLPPPKNKLNLISQSEYDNFIDVVCKPSNHFMHDASAFPNSAYEAAYHLGNIGASFCQILKLI
jgi:hypothetical protein